MVEYCITQQSLCWPSVLTVRDPEKWHASAMQTIYGVRSVPLSQMGPLGPVFQTIRPMHDHVMWDGTFHGRFADKQHAIDVFNRHNDEVKRVVPQERLLVYDVKEGWGPLCEFLGVEEPDKPFPRLNDAAEVQRLILAVRVFSVAIPTALALLVGIAALAMLGKGSLRS